MPPHQDDRPAGSFKSTQDREPEEVLPRRPSSPATGIYSSLSDEEEEIRLLSILPASDDSNSNSIKSHLQRVRLKHMGPDQNYIALSYTWGDRSTTLPITVNGETMQVTTNLESALRYLRVEFGPTFLFWIDAVCINQEDVDERTHQVGMMREIYKSALYVVTWLGPAADDSDRLLDFLNDVGRKAHENNLNGLTVYGSLITEKGKVAESAHTAFNDVSSRLEDFLNLAPARAALLDRDYWFRVWVVQEVSLAKSVVFACGSKRIRLEHLHAGSEFWSSFLVAKAKATHGPDNAELVQRITDALAQDPSLSALGAMMNIRAEFRKEADDGYNDISLGRLLVLLNARWGWGWGRRLQATDPLDKVFGLLGLASDATKLGIVPNYKMSYRDLCVKVALALLDRGDMTTLVLGRSGEIDIGLPTWIPDWRTTNPPMVGQEKFEVPFCAGGANVNENESESVAEKAFVRNEGEILVLRGHEVDTVDLLSRSWSSYDDDWLQGSLTHFEVARQVFKELDCLCDISQLRGQAPQYVEQACWRVPIGDKAINTLVKGFQRAPEAIKFQYTELREVIAQCQEAMASGDPEKLRSGLDRYRTSRCGDYMSSMAGMPRRIVFLTKLGYLGLGPESLKADDLVCIFPGARTPLALRLDAGKGCYSIIGAAYVHGIMDGELMAEKAGQEWSLFNFC
jgi:hypothetical protein